LRETSLAEHVPLWRTLREDGVTALVTPALDYVGCLGLDGIDTRFFKEDERAQRGEAIRELLGGLDDEVSLLLLYRVHEDVEADIAAYQAGVATPATPAVSAYVAAKGGQIGWSRSMARELAPCGITVNMVAPGWIPVERHEKESSEVKEAYRKLIPTGRWGTPRDVAEAVLYLASEEASFVTGQTINVNGGMTPT